MGRPIGARDKKPRKLRKDTPMLGKKGKPGRCAGAPPKGESMGELLVAAMRGTIKLQDGSYLDTRKAIAEYAVRDALSPDPAVRIRVREWIFDRLEGRARQMLELTGAEGGPIKTESSVHLDAEIDSILAKFRPKE